MYRKAIWIIFLTLIGALAIWFIVIAGCEVYRYFQLKVRVEATVSQWSVQEVKSDQFAVVAHYTYTFQDKTYTGEGSVGGSYPNPWAAQEAKTRFEKQRWLVWLNPEHPEKSVVQKHFPLKKALSATVLIGLVLYFLALGLYLRRKHG